MAEEAINITEHQKLDSRFIRNLKGKDFVLYTGLLDLGHQIGIRSIQVEPVQYPTEENGNEGICRATVVSMDGRTFTEIGDASPRNVSSQISSHVLRMAATRAKARALRDMTNIGMTCLEELGEPETGDPRVIPMKKTKGRGNNVPESEAAVTKVPDLRPQTIRKPVEAFHSEKISKAGISTAQRHAILSLAKRKGIPTEDLLQQIEETFGVEIDALSSKEASDLIRNLQTA